MAWRLSGFADEAGLALASQLQASRDAGLSYIDLRSIGEHSIVELPEDEARACASELRRAGLYVNMFGSPIGKVDIADPFEPQREKLEHLARMAEIFDCRDVRVFSFFDEEQATGEVWRERSIERLRMLRERARELGIRLWLENERFTFADRCPECLTVAEALYDPNTFRLIFDFDNFVQSGDDCWENWQKLQPYVGAFHLKEATADGTHVPVGEGAGQVEAILRDALALGWDGSLSLEPHLAHSPAVMATGPHGRANQALSDLTPQQAYVYAAQVAQQLLTRIGAVDEYKRRQMQAKSTYRVAIIGAGGIAGVHARAIRDLPEAELVAVSRRDHAKARAFAEEYGGEPFSDNEQMLASARPDLVVVCTPSGVHGEAIRLCLEAGVPVLCEKPLEITTERIDELIALADRTGTPLGGIFMQRFSPLMQTVHEAAASGRFGAMAAINGSVPWWRDDAYYSPERWQGTLAYDGGGALMNQAIHIVDMVQWLAGAAMDDIDEQANPVTEVMAYTAKRGHDPQLIEVEDTASVALRFRNGALGQLFAATSMYPGARRRVQLGGRDGLAETVEDELVTWHFREDSADDERVRERFGQAGATTGGAADPMAIDYENHRRNIAAFLDACANASPFMLNAREARKAVAIIEAIYKSARSNQPQPVG